MAHFHLRTYSQVQEIFALHMMKIKTCRILTQMDKPTSGKHKATALLHKGNDFLPNH